MINILDQKLNKILKEYNIAGMSAAITNRENIIYKSSFGTESTERPDIPTHPDALYRVASVTKMVTGLCIMKLCEEGYLCLDTPISRYIPWISLENGAEDIITMKHLLSHTAGLPGEYTPDGPREESALEISLKKELADVKMTSHPSEGKYLYSNLGIRLASYIAQIKTGKPYSVLAEEYVLNPLGMTYSTFDLRDAATYPLSLPHDDVDGKLMPQHHIKENAARLAAGGLYSNTEDLCKLARCILNNGKNVVTKDSLSDMLTPISDVQNNNIDNYGLTIMSKKYKHGIMYGHLGDASPYGAGVFADVKSGYAAVVLMNTFRSELRTQIPEMLLNFVTE